MYERRLGRLHLVFLVALLLIGVRVFRVQVLDVEDDRDALAARLTSERVVLPRRGRILYADGTPLARNEPAYAVDVDFRDFDADRFRNLRTGQVRSRRHAGPLRPTEESSGEPADHWRRLGWRVEVDPDVSWWGSAESRRAVRSERPPREPPESWTESGDEWELLPRPDLAELAAVFDLEPEELRRALLRARLRRERAGWGRYAEFPLLHRVSRAAAMRLRLRADEFPGVTPRARPHRATDATAVQVAGRTRDAWPEDRRRLTDESRAEQGLPVYSNAAVYRLQFGHRGLEGAFDERLRGTPGRVRRVRRPDGEFETEVLRQVQDGADLVTTLSPRVQAVAEDVVGAAPNEAAAVVLDLDDGGVVAIASKSADGFHHAVVPVAPGSVYKLVSGLAGLMAGSAPSDTVDCHRRGVLPSGQRYSCLGHHPDVDLLTAFEKSCNTYFMQRSWEAGVEVSLDAAARLGFDLSPRLHLHGRASGLPYSPGGPPWSETMLREWNRRDLAQVGMGQGIATASPLQIAVAYARIATGGRRIRPYLVEGDGPHPETFEYDPVLRRFAPVLREAARRVVQTGTARKVRALQELRAAGKSGTATPPARLERFETGHENNAWFVGFAPFDSPRFVAVVVQEYSRGHGAEESGPLVARLLAEALDERGVADVR